MSAWFYFLPVVLFSSFDKLLLLFILFEAGRTGVENRGNMEYTPIYNISWRGLENRGNMEYTPIYTYILDGSRKQGERGLYSDIYIYPGQELKTGGTWSILRYIHISWTGVENRGNMEYTPIYTYILDGSRKQGEHGVYSDINIYPERK